ncbi:SRPBCC family protein [Dechloromonas sp. XY25]|uniref:SRPBCC family protein n=1 Tax=Dechloromonas hankyongensis TaxID=2908002 RepID=A0ABS9K364_9RHOO|nr:SRPBCC family protein [Dechloromonas hankyongensis]MCG2577621.1 SRPBCC family protein [Dechloromonas hankyongensis]
MAEYHLLTIWRINAPLTEVYNAIHDSTRWPEWWPGAEKVEPIASTEGDGVNGICRFSWRGRLPYLIVFDIHATRIKKLVAIEGRATGDLEGVGHWRFSRRGSISIVRFEWHVRSTKWWMNLLAPLARSIFISNHVRLMTQGGEGLAALLRSPLVSQKSIDLMAQDQPPAPDHLRRHQGGRIDPAMVLMAGLFAGTVATLVQLALWWLTDVPLLPTLVRDAHLTAAIAMGPGILASPLATQWEVLMVATLIHFGLSVFYAIVPALIAGRLGALPALVVGSAYGLAIYALNLHGFTAVFPWFAVSRDWPTLAAHAVFGLALFGWCLLSGRRPPPTEISRRQ